MDPATAGYPILWGHPLASVLVAPGHVAGPFSKRMSRFAVGREYWPENNVP